MGWNPFKREGGGSEQGKEFKRAQRPKEAQQAKPERMPEFSPATPEDASREDAQRRIAAVLESAAFSNTEDADMRIEVINAAKRLEVAMQKGSELIDPAILEGLEAKAAGLDMKKAA